LKWWRWCLAAIPENHLFLQTIELAMWVRSCALAEAAATKLPPRIIATGCGAPTRMMVTAYTIPKGANQSASESVRDDRYLVEKKSFGG
jgi:hypothetical protein